MKVNHNIAAVLANQRLQTTENKLSASVGKLSSGYKINSAKDNPAGFAIAHKMNTQLRGLDRASDNAMDGVSAIETAEGALVEVTNMLQRLRELAVQSANDTYTLEDREAIQKEVDKLQDEIQRISRDTEFNKQSLLDGTFDTRAYSNTDGVSARLLSDEVPAGPYTFKINGIAERATLTSAAVNIAAFGAAPGVAETFKMAVNDVSVEISTADTFETAYGKIRDAAEKSGVEALYDNTTNTITFLSEEYGSKYSIDIAVSTDTGKNILGLGTTTFAAGKDADITLDLTDPSKFKNTATCTGDGEYVKITDRGGFEMTIKVDNDEYQKIMNDDTESLAGTTTTIDVKGFGYMSLQIGANENQIMNVRIPDMSLDSMGIVELNYLTHEGSSEAITKIDDALAYVSSARSKLGAYQNRLDYTISSLDITNESLTEAYSRIVDVDMAEEMTNYTQYNVLQQAGVSVLAQANDLPQTVLQLLQ